MEELDYYEEIKIRQEREAAAAAERMAMLEQARVAEMAKSAKEIEQAAEETEESKPVSEYMNSDLNHDKRNAQMKKIFALGTIAGMGANEIAKKSPYSVAARVDEGLGRAKISYQSGIGKIDPLEVGERLIDQAAARAAAFLPKFIENGLPKAIDKIGAYVETVCPPATPVVEVVKHVTKRATKPIATAVAKAVPVVAKVAKTCLRAAASVVRSNPVFAIGRKILSWL